MSDGNQDTIVNKYTIIKNKVLRKISGAELFIHFN